MQKPVHLSIVYFILHRCWLNQKWAKRTCNFVRSCYARIWHVPPKKEEVEKRSIEEQFSQLEWMAATIEAEQIQQQRQKYA